MVALGQQLPFADGAFDAAWCLGVLCTTSDKAGALAELRRVLRRGGRLGLLVFVADGPLPPPLPEGNEFPSEEELLGLLRDAGFALEETADADLGDSPPEWTERADAVDAEVARRHGDDPAFRQAQENAAAGRPAARPTASCGPGWGSRSPDVSARCAQCKEMLAKKSLHSYGPVVPVDATPLEPAVQVTDVRALRALAHPLRNRLLGQLRLNGPATASQLGRVVGESSGSTSYHLRQLAAVRLRRGGRGAGHGAGALVARPAPDDQLAGRGPRSRRRAARRSRTR